MNVLCVCRRGNSRSVALAWYLKHKLKYEAIAIGIRQHSEDTKKMLYDWADLIILVDKKFLPEVPQEYLSKLEVWDVGTDIWFKGFDKGLIETYKNYISEWQKKKDTEDLPNMAALPWSVEMSADHSCHIIFNQYGPLALLVSPPPPRLQSMEKTARTIREALDLLAERNARR